MKIRNDIMRHFLYTALLLLCGQLLNAQVFPGDANLNGRVDHQDMLSIGYAYGSTGPARIQMGTEFIAMPIDLPWSLSFPNDVNYAHADANGNGQVDITDMLTVVTNYGLIHNTPVAPDYPMALPNIDPQLQLIPEQAGQPLTAGSALNIAVELAHFNGVKDDINGLAFSIDFNKNYIQSITLSYDEGWLGGPDNAFSFQTIDPQQTDQLDLASTRYGVDGTNPEGPVGVLSLVIEDDLITFMETDSIEILITTDEIMMVDEQLDLQPVNRDTVRLTIYNPTFLVTSQQEEMRAAFKCFPNPVLGDQLHLVAEDPLEQVILYTLNGQQVLEQALPAVRQGSLNIPYEWRGAIYLLRLRTTTGRINEQLIFIP
jgi:hypothetical protein